MVGISQRTPPLYRPFSSHVYMSSFKAKFTGGKKSFHKVLDYSDLQSLMLLIVISAKITKDYILQKLETHPFINFFGTGKKSKDS